MKTPGKTVKRTANCKRYAATGFAFIMTVLQTTAQETQTTAQTASEPVVKVHSLFDSSLFVALLVLSLLLAIVIVVFSQVAKATIKIKMEKQRKEKADSGTKIVVLTTGMMLLAGNAFTQTDSTALATKTIGSGMVDKYPYWGMDATTFWVMAFAILIELIVIRQLYVLIMDQLGVYELREKRAEDKRLATIAVNRPTFMEKLNRSVAIEKEADIMLDHNYDGIRELDNNLPPWWKYGFYLTIIFALVYLTHYHITKTGNLQTAEYKQEILRAKLEMDEYRSKAANLVDENNAELLTDQASLASGKAVFTTNCIACHGNAGEGGVGPNLTDAFWLHQGGIKDVFKTIKYGYPEKGMKSWQQDLGAKQIHEVASYVLSLQGTNPPNAKEPEGEKYQVANADTVQ